MAVFRRKRGTRRVSRLRCYAAYRATPTVSVFFPPDELSFDVETFDRRRVKLSQNNVLPAHRTPAVSLMKRKPRNIHLPREKKPSGCTAKYEKRYVVYFTTKTIFRF